MDWQTCGHEKNKLLLQKQLELGSLPHAYLFYGPAGIGKKTLALELAKKILETASLNSHPDFQMLDEAGEIGIGAVRDFIGKLSFKPFVAQKKVAVINGSENLNPQSGNALLKTLEEPSPNTVIILIASGKLLPTIVSRCQVLRFYAFSQTQLAEFGKKTGLKASKEILNLAFGSPAKLKLLAEDSDYLDRQKKAAEQFLAIKSYGLGQRLAAINRLAEAETQDLRNQLLGWLDLQVSGLAQKPSEFLKARVLMDAAGALAMNKNKKLVLQTLMFKI